MRKRGALLFLFSVAFLVSALYASAEKPGDYNGDGCVTQDDYAGFSAAYTAGDLAANLDGNEVVDLEDFFYFSGLIEKDKECSAQNIPTEKTASSVATEPAVEESRLQEPALEEPLEEQPLQDSGWSAQDSDEGGDEEGSAGMISVPSAVILQARPLGNGKIVLSWTRSEIVEEALTGRLVLNKISGAFAINELTGKIGFIDSIVDFFKGLFGMKAKASRVSGSGEGERDIFYKVLKQDAFGNFKVVAEVEDKDCGEECSYTDKQAEGVVSYQVEACYQEICKASQVVSVDAVVHAVSVDAGVDAGVGGGASGGNEGAGDVDAARNGSMAGEVSGEVSSESTETKSTETKISEISCDPVAVFKEASSLLGDAGAFQAAWQEKVVPCCREVNAARENGIAVEESWVNACAGVKEQ